MSDSTALRADVVLPVKEELLKAMQNAELSPELASYLQQRVHEIVESSRFYNKSPEAMKAAEEVLAAVDEFVQFVEYKFSQRSDIWLGVLPETSSFKNMQKGIAEKAVSNLTEKDYEQIRFDFAISNEGHFVRGYAGVGPDAPPLDQGTIDSLDQLFNAWLSEKLIASEAGYLFRTNAGGVKGEKLTLAKVEELLADSAKDFKDYLARNNVSTQLVSRQREYPNETRLQDLKREADNALRKYLEETKERRDSEVVVEETETPKTPDTNMSH